MEPKWITKPRQRRDAKLWPTFEAYDALRTAMMKGSGDVESLIREAPVSVFYINGSRQNSNCSSLLLHALDKRIPHELASRYAHAILDRAPWLAPPRELMSIPRGAHEPGRFTLRTQEGTPSLERALIMGDEQLALRLLDLGAKMTRLQFERTVGAGMPKLRHYVLSRLSDLPSIVKYYTACSGVEQQWVIDCLDRNFNEELAPKILGEVAAKSDIADFLNDFHRRVVSPALRFERFPEPTLLELTRFVFAERGEVSVLAQAWIDHALMQEHKRPSQVLRELTELSYSWHHPRVVFPELPYIQPEQYKIPSAMTQEWYPLVKEPFHASNGLVIRSLTSKPDLETESRVLGHCVRGYADDCCQASDARRHIFSIRTAEGDSLSTVEIQCTKRPDRYALASIQVQDGYLHVLQHEGKKQHMVRQFIKAGPCHEALKEFLAAIKTGQIPLEKELGETAESKRVDTLPGVIKSCGYYPSRHNIDLTFQEFKKDVRRGANAVDSNGWLVYNDTITPDGYAHQNHFIGGTVQENGQRFDLAHMTTHEWLNALGLTHEKKPLSASLPPPAKEHETHTARLRHAARVESGTLNRHEQRSLNSTQRRHYEGRLSEIQKEKPYLARQ